MPRADGQTHVFGRNRPYGDAGKMKKRFDALLAQRAEQDAALKVAPWRLKDLQKTVGTGLARLGVAPTVIDVVLAHKLSGVTFRHYAHYNFLPEHRAALERWARHLARVVSGDSETVVTLVR